MGHTYAENQMLSKISRQKNVIVIYLEKVIEQFSDMYFILL